MSSAVRKKSSLGAYTAWLTKHETKAVRRRRALPEVIEEWVDHAVPPPAPTPPTDTQVDATPEPPTTTAKKQRYDFFAALIAAPAVNAKRKRAESLVSAESPRTTRRTDPSAKPTILLATKKRPTPTILTTIAQDKTKKQKRSSHTDLPLNSEATRPPSPSPKGPSHIDDSPRAVHVNPTRSSRSQATRSSKTTRSIRMPALEEARYWQDVDRFAFLS